MSFSRLVKSVAVLGLIAFALQVSVDSDTWWHLAAGRWMAAHGRILQIDVFSITRSGARWVNPGWLAQLLLFGVYSLAGYAGLNLFTASMAVGAFVLIWPRLEGSNLLRAFVVLLAGSAAAIFWSARPHMFSFVLAAATISIVEDWRTERSTRLWVLPVLMILWANLHGGFAIGYILLAGYVAGEAIEGWLARDHEPRGALVAVWERVRPLLAVGSASLLGTCLNPSGPRLLLYPFQTVSIGALQNYIQEWQSPNFHSPQVLPFTILLLATMVALSLSHRRKGASELILLTGLTFLALLAARNIATFALVASLVLSRHLNDSSSRFPLRGSRGQFPATVTGPLNLIFFVLLGLGVLAWSLPKLTTAGNAEALRIRFPAGAVTHLMKTRPEGPLVHSYNWGGYLVWRLWPDYRSYVDGRTDLFGQDLLDEYLQVWQAEPEWQEIVERRGFQTALLEPWSPLTLVLQSQGWTVAYQDDQAVVLEREGGQGGP